MSFTDLPTALAYIAGHPGTSIYGTVVVAGVEYYCDEMRDLVGRSVEGWSFPDGVTAADGASIFVG